MTQHNSYKGVVHQVNISRGGVPKRPIDEAHVTEAGVAGDKQRDRRFHGGPQRAICLYSLDLIEALQDEGHPIAPGTTGENLTIAGLDWSRLEVGTQLRIGDELHLEITSYATPCSNIKGSFADESFKRISQKVNPGTSRVYARVLASGRVRPGDRVEIVASTPDRSR